MSDKHDQSFDEWIVDVFGETAHDSYGFGREEMQMAFEHGRTGDHHDCKTSGCNEVTVHVRIPLEAQGVENLKVAAAREGIPVDAYVMKLIVAGLGVKSAELVSKLSDRFLAGLPAKGEA